MKPIPLIIEDSKVEPITLPLDKLVGGVYGEDGIRELRDKGVSDDRGEGDKNLLEVQQGRV